MELVSGCRSNDTLTVLPLTEMQAVHRARRVTVNRGSMSVVIMEHS